MGDQQMRNEKRKRIPGWKSDSDVAKYVSKNGRSRLAMVRYLIFRSDLRLLELRVALYLCLRCNFSSFTRISGTEIAREIGSSNSNHVLKSAKRLHYLGIVERQDQHPKKSAYRLSAVFGGKHSLVAKLHQKKQGKESESNQAELLKDDEDDEKNMDPGPVPPWLNEERWERLMLWFAKFYDQHGDPNSGENH